MTILSLLIVAAIGIFTWFLTSVIRRVALKKHILDIPNERSSHDVPTPRGGGLAIAISWYIGITVFYYMGALERDLYIALLFGIILAVISLIDDLGHLKPAIRLIFHFIAATGAFYFLHGLQPGFQEKSLNLLILYPLAIVGIVWFINLFNFMDGIDAFASVEVIMVACFLFVLSWNIIFLVLISCVAGFLYWNWPKAKVFMGDVGSTQLGFILIVFGIYLHNKSELSIISWIMLTSAFWFDATLTLYRKWRNGENLSEAHRKHAYQRIVQSGFSHLQTVTSLIMINIFIIILVIAGMNSVFLQVIFLIINILFLYFLTRLVDKRIPFRKSNSLVP